MYALSRDGGPKSERFTAYVARVEQEWGLVAYNPMAGDAARETVTQLLSLDAENVARNIAAHTAMLCEYEQQITLALVVRSKGMWTDRVATEVDDRFSTRRSRPDHGLVSMWSRESCDLDDVTREVVAEVVREMWASIHDASDRPPFRFYTVRERAARLRKGRARTEEQSEGEQWRTTAWAKLRCLHVKFRCQVMTEPRGSSRWSNSTS